MISSLSTARACVLVLMALITGCSGDGSAPIADDAPPSSPGDIRGGVMLSLGEPGDGRGLLTVVSLPIREPVTPSAQLDVNAAASACSGGLAITNDGRLAFVAEARGGGDSVASVDLTNPAAPRLLGRAFVGIAPQGLSLHPAGDLLAVATRQPGAPLVMLPLDSTTPSRMGEALAWPLSGIRDESADVSCVAWHPSGRLLAVTLPGADEVALFAVSRKGADIQIALAAPPTPLGSTPLHAEFAQGGRVLLCLCDNPKPGGAAEPIASGQLCAIAVPELPPTWDVKGSLMGAMPRIIDRVTVAPGPVGLAISPSGREAATISTSGPDGTPGRAGTLHVFDLSERGELTGRTQTALGAVPAGVSFDTASRFVLVSQFGSLDPDAAAGEVSFWRLGRQSLIQQNFFVGIGPGPYGSLLVR